MKATEVTAGPAESNGSLLPGIWRDSLHVTCGLTACTPGSARGPTLGNEYGKTLPFAFTLFSGKLDSNNLLREFLRVLMFAVLDISCAYRGSEVQGGPNNCTFSDHRISATVQDTRSSAIADGLRDATCQSNSCQLLHNSVGVTTCTTSSEQIQVMELESYSRPTYNKLVHSATTRSTS